MHVTRVVSMPTTKSTKTRITKKVVVIVTVGGNKESGNHGYGGNYGDGGNYGYSGNYCTTSNGNKS